MKKLLFLLFIILFSNSCFSASGWFTQYTTSGSVYDICMLNSNTGYVCGTGGLILKTTNGGVNWVQQTISEISDFITISFYDVNIGWVATHENYIKVYYTSNGGASWNMQYTQAYYFKVPRVSYALSPATHYLGLGSDGTIFSSSGLLLKSDNYGVNYGTSQDIGGGDLLSINFVNNSTGWSSIYKWSDFQRVCFISKTTDGGSSWVIQSADSFYSSREIKFLNALTGYASGNAGYNAKFRRTTDGGETWTYNYILNREFATMDFANVNTGYAGGYSSSDSTYISKTTDGGFNWVGQKTDNQINQTTKIRFVNDLTGWVIGRKNTSGVILKTSNGGVTFVNNVSTEIPDKFSLEQNYPNPFNLATKIRFALPVNSFVKISVFDINGREVNKLVSENIQAGDYETEFNAANLSSGIYYYRIETVKFTETKKMILLK